MVYEAREDSWLLERVVSERAFGRVIDVGTGSGILALAAKGSEVLAVDINPDAVSFARSQGVTAVESDLFSAVSGMFDTIICNTPYLPDEPLAPDVALDGGEKGFEWTLRFLEECKTHLARDGQVLFLISSFTNPSVVEEWLVKNTFSFEVVASEKLSFEELFVYRATWALPDRPDAVFVARGRRSRVYRDGDVAIKLADARRVSQEAHMLSSVNKLGLGPKLIEASENRLCVEFIDGVRIDRFLASCSLGEASWALSEVFRQCEVLDEAGINKQEMTNPYKHVIIAGDRVVMIDWERAKKSLRPANEAQFREYLKRVQKTFPHLSEVSL